MEEFEVIADAGFQVGDTLHAKGAAVPLNAGVGEWAVAQGYVRAAQAAVAENAANTQIATPPASKKANR